MKDRKFSTFQIPLTAAATIYIAGLLAWQHLHGGVVSHHILHRSDMPAISNWWGALILPVLTWFLAGRISHHAGGQESRSSILRLAGALLYGAILSAAYLNGYESVTTLMGPGILVLALFIPIYKAEYVLGFVLSMTFTFGAILPTAFAGVMALIGFTIYRFIRPVPKYILSVASRIRNRG